MNRKTSAPASPAPAADYAQPADIGVLIRVVELGTFSAAARERNLPVSQVTRAIDRLEAFYGVRLLRRSTHGLSVTPEGAVVLAHGREALTTLDNLADELARGTRSAAGPVRLAVSMSMAEQLIVPALPELLACHPGLRLQVLADDRIADLPTEGIDVALRTGAVSNESLVAREIGSFSRALYCAPSYLARREAPALPEDLHQHAMITHLAIGQLNRWRFTVDHQLVEMNLSGTVSVNSTWLVRQMVLQGLGIGRLSIPLAEDGVRSGALVEVLAPFRDRSPIPVYAVMLPDRQRLPRIRAVVDFLSQVMARSAWARIPPAA